MSVASVEKSPWQVEGEEKRLAVRRMFAEIAPSYDLVNSLMSLARHRAWRAYAVSLLNLRPGDKALDICCGTGDFLVPLSKAVGDPLTRFAPLDDLSHEAPGHAPSPGSLRSPTSPTGGEVGLAIGADYCAPMLHIAAKKLGATKLLLSDACALPFTSETFDAVTVGWGLRNLADLNAGLSEVVRVLKPKGRFVSLDMAIPRNRLVKTVSHWVCGGVLPKLGKLFGSKEAYTYLPKSTEAFATREELKQAFERAGLTDVRWKDLMLGNICVVWGRKP